MINDFINLTQGQLLVKYWWLWLSILVLFIIYIILDKGEIEMFRKRKTKKSNEYKPVRANDYVGTDKGNLYIRPKEGGEVRATEESQLNRIEAKMDRILHLLGKEELSKNNNASKLIFANKNR